MRHRALNLIVQHWHGADLPPIVERSCANMRAYAQRIGADYRMLVGYPFNPRFSPQAQKLAMVNEEFDDFATVVMVDSDQFAVKGLTQSIFEATGYGWHHDTAHPRVVKAFPQSASSLRPFWGGAVYRLPRGLRVVLRDAIDSSLAQFDNPRGGWDEGMFHRLAMRASLSQTNAYFSDKRWCHGNCESHLERAAFVHVRTRPSKSKLENYQALVAAGLLE